MNEIFCPRFNTVDSSWTFLSGIHKDQSQPLLTPGSKQCSAAVNNRTLIMRDLRLSKYGFRLNLKGVLKVTSWCGLIYYVIMFSIGISLMFVPQLLVKYFNSRTQIPENLREQYIQELPEPYRGIYHSQWQVITDGFSTLYLQYVIQNVIMPFGAVLAIWSVAWFGFFFVFQRNVAKEDFVKIRNLLAKSTFIRGGIVNAVNLAIIVIMIVILSIKVGGAYCCMLLLLSIIMVIFNSIMMEGVFHRKSKPVEVFIIFSHITFILWALSLLIGTIILSVNLKLPWFFLAGFILFLISLLVYTFNISIILCLHSIILSSSTEINNLPIFSRSNNPITISMLP